MNILLVDNDINTVETIKAALTIKADYKIDVAYGGKEALEKMKKNHRIYDLLILDLMMPEISGIDVCKLMIRDRKLRKIPVLIISALPVNSKTFRESQEKFDEFIVVKGVIEKPFDIDELLAKIKAILAKGRSQK